MCGAKLGGSLTVWGQQIIPVTIQQKDCIDQSSRFFPDFIKLMVYIIINTYINQNGRIRTNERYNTLICYNKGLPIETVISNRCTCILKT